KNFKTIRPAIPEIPDVKVWKGKKNRCVLLAQNVYSNDPLDSFTVLADRGGGDLRWDIYVDELIAPLEKGTLAGKLVLYDGDGELLNVNLLTAEDIEKGGFFKRLLHSVILFFKGLGKSNS
ncbi:MAG: D-alanyl-D-alanine carboxypeptidase, partial [Spirochaetaceae bacterium]|nr:D-alanyl-D-alanine carboxypeptidase [Spirochaetaceae bacterium]